MHLIGIYDADASVTGEIRYLLRKVFSNDTCALCELTHGWNPLGKTAWRNWKGSAPSVRWLHRDQLPPEKLKAIAGDIPCLALEKNNGLHVFISSKEIESCGNDVGLLRAFIDAKLEALTPSNH